MVTTEPSTMMKAEMVAVEVSVRQLTCSAVLVNVVGSVISVSAVAVAAA